MASTSAPIATISSSVITATIQFDDPNKVLTANTKNYRSTPLMTKYEFNQIIGLRTMHLSKGAPPLIELEEGEKQIETNIMLRRIAERELLQGRLSYIVKRPMPNGKIEYWPIDKLDITAVKNLFRHSKA